MLLLFSAASEVDLNSTRWTLSRTGWFWFALLFSSWQPRLDKSWFFLATILKFSWWRHTSSWTQRSFISQMATLWKSCSRYKRILLTPFLDGKLLQKTQVTSVLYSAMKSNSASGEGSEVSSIGVTYFENNAKDKMRFCWVFYFVQISLSP